jgi:hypothetical protein
VTEKTATETIEYVGPYDEVELPISPSVTLLAKREDVARTVSGEAAQIPSEIAENLKAQGIWSAPKSHRSKKEES